MRRFLLLAALFLLLPGSSLAHVGHQVSHSEVVRAGPYTITVEFSEWPIKAERSLDIVFWLDGGIEGASGTVRRRHQDSGSVRGGQLVRHPRYRTAWGLDQTILPLEGEWRFEFEIDGPRGKGVGQSLPVPVLARPGPPPALSYLFGVIPLLAMAVFLFRESRRVRRLNPPDAASW